MNGRLLLDTNIVIALLGQDASVRSHLTRAVEVFIPSIVVGELYYGARKSRHAEANLARVDELATRSAVLPCDTTTAQQYGRIKDLLRTKGRPIPENDIWIAAVAQQHQLTLVSRDEHFREVQGLPLERW